MATVDKIDVDGAGVHVEDGKAVGSTGESLSIEEDNRLLRKIDRWYGSTMATDVADTNYMRGWWLIARQSPACHGHFILLPVSRQNGSFLHEYSRHTARSPSRRE